MYLVEELDFLDEFKKKECSWCSSIKDVQRVIQNRRDEILTLVGQEIIEKTREEFEDVLISQINKKNFMSKEKKHKLLKPWERLEAGETFINAEPGNSMTPILKSRQRVVLTPTSWKDVEPGDIVYCKVAGNFYTHKVIAKSETRGVQIGNNHGHINGWTKHVYGKVIKILADDETWEPDIEAND